MLKSLIYTLVVIFAMVSIAAIEWFSVRYFGRTAVLSVFAIGWFLGLWWFTHKWLKRKGKI